MSQVVCYSTYGSVRGCCGHRHQTADAVQRCADRDQARCASQGGYSDRSVCEVNEDGVLYYSVADDSWIPGPGGRSCGAARL
jgi:hypothetical protein